MNEPTTRVRSRFIVILGVAFLIYGALGLTYPWDLASHAIPRLVRERAAKEFGDTTTTRLVEFLATIASQGFSVIALACGIGLVRRRGAATPWALVLAAGMAVMLGYGVVRSGSRVFFWPFMSPQAPSTWLGYPLALFYVAAPIVFLPATIVLVRSRSAALGPTSTRSWVAALVTITTLHATLLTQNSVSRRKMAAFREQPGSPERTTDPGTGRIVIVPTFNEETLVIPDALATVLLSDTRSDLRQPSVGHGDREVDARFAHGEIVLTDVPTGHYRVMVTIDANPDNGRQMAGDYVTSFERKNGEDLLDYPLQKDGQTIRREMPMIQMIALVAPSSLAGLPPGMPGDPLTLQSPIEFAWEPVTGAVRYHYKAVREQGGGADVAAKGDGPDPAWAIDLAALDDARSRYWLHVQADGVGGRIGVLHWSAKFVVR